MYSEFEKVKIKSKGIIGTIVDVTKTKNGDLYMVETSEKGDYSDAYGTEFPIFDCFAEDLEKLN